MLWAASDGGVNEKLGFHFVGGLSLTIYGLNLASRPETGLNNSPLGGG